jgi:hypothetical protein
MTWWRRHWERIAGAAKPDAPPRQAATRVTEGSGERSQFHSSLPRYAALEKSCVGKDRRDFSDLEDSPQLDSLRDQFQSELLSPSRYPAEDEPLLITFFIGSSGVFTLTEPDSKRPCLLTFSSPIRAGEYARIHAGSLSLRYFSSSPKGFVRMMGDLKRSGTLESFALDVCPHCMIFPVYEINSQFAPEHIIKTWATHKSGELARESLYFARATEATAKGDFRDAKETALYAIQHVTSESPRLHLLLGKISLSLGDKDLFREVKAFLEFLQADHFLQDLLAAEQSSEIKN